MKLRAGSRLNTVLDWRRMSNGKGEFAEVEESGRNQDDENMTWCWRCLLLLLGCCGAVKLRVRKELSRV